MLLLEIHDDVVTTLEKIKNVSNDTIEIEVPDGSVLFDNIINLKLIVKEAEYIGKSLTFITKDEIGKELIGMLNGDTGSAEGFVTKEFSTDELGDSRGELTYKNKHKGATSKTKISMPKLAIKNPFAFLQNFSSKGFILAIIVFLMFLGGGYYFFWQVPKADVKVVVTSQPLIKSVTIKVKASSATNAEKLILKGETVQAVTSETTSIETTGEKTVGEKAQGSIKIYNRTTSEISLKEGTTITFSDTDNDYVYSLEDDVKIPPEALQDPLDPASLSVPGEASADVTALEFGEEYNIDSGKTLEVEDYKKSELSAASSGKIDGGSSKIVKIVAEEDLTKLAEALTAKLIDSSETLLKAKTSNKKKLVVGSTSTQVTTETYTGEVGDELDELELTQQVTAEGLSYSTSDLNSLLDKLVEDFVPKNFKLSDEERNVNVEILGNSDNTVLSSTEADLQVTLKTFVVPDINSDELKKKLVGQSVTEAQKILGSVRNVDTYELKVSPNIPFIRKLPSKADNITLNVSLE